MSYPMYRTARLGLRLSPEKHELLRRAAETIGQTLTDFVLHAATQAAETALLDTRMLQVYSPHYHAFLDQLAGLQAAPASLEALLNAGGPPPWDEPWD